MTGPVGASRLAMVPHGSHPFTGLPRDVSPVAQPLCPDSMAHRERILRRALLDGADWEEGTGTLLDKFCAAVTKPDRKPGAKRMGAKNQNH